MQTVMKDLTDQELAGLHVKFVVPMAVSDVLRGDEVLDDVTEYTIHEMIGSMKPDTALLGIALCAQHIAAHAGDLPIATVLGGEADRIISDYGPLWLAHARGGKGLDDQMVGEALAQTPEYLESIGDLLLATCGELGPEFATVATLAEILGSEAHMHRVEAEMLLETLFIPDTATDMSNVVVFPGAPHLSLN